MITGKLVFSDSDSITEVTEVRVILEDTSRVGASSVAIAEQSITVDPATLKQGVPFAFDNAMPASGLTIRAHLSQNGTLEIELGDHITMGAFPADVEDVEVILKKVR